MGESRLDGGAGVCVCGALIGIGPFRRWRRCRGVLPAALEAVTLAVHLHDVHVVGEAVQQCAGEPFRPEDHGPLVEGEVGGHQGRSSLVALAEDLEEEFRAGGGQGHKAQLVDDEQPETGQLPLQVEQPTLVPRLHQFVHQCRGGGEAHRQPRWQAASPKPRATWVLPVPLLPMAMTFS